MQTPDLTKCPAIDPANDIQIAELLPPPARIFPNFIAAGIASIGESLPPGADWAPTAFVGGWDAIKPTMDILSLDARFYRDGNSKQALAGNLAQMVLQRRMLEQETYCIALAHMGWMAAQHVPKSDLHILRSTILDADANGISHRPEKLEVMMIEINWQDGQLLLGAPVTRSADAPPRLDLWRNISAGATMVRNRFWHTIAPTLAAMPYAEAMLAQFETGEEQP